MVAKAINKILKYINKNLNDKSLKILAYKDTIIFNIKLSKKQINIETKLHF